MSRQLNRTLVCDMLELQDVQKSPRCSLSRKAHLETDTDESRKTRFWTFVIHRYRSVWRIVQNTDVTPRLQHEQTLLSFITVIFELRWNSWMLSVCFQAAFTRLFCLSSVGSVDCKSSHPTRGPTWILPLLDRPEQGWTHTYTRLESPL